MPELCRFHGVVIQIHPRDHLPPHFHAKTSDSEILIAISTQQIIAGNLPPRLRREVVQWAALRQLELEAAWEAIRRHELPDRIAPPD